MPPATMGSPPELLLAGEEVPGEGWWRQRRASIDSALRSFAPGDLGSAMAMGAERGTGERAGAGAAAAGTARAPAEAGTARAAAGAEVLSLSSCCCRDSRRIDDMALRRRCRRYGDDEATGMVLLRGRPAVVVCIIVMVR